jgi:hypothetical protein
MKQATFYPLTPYIMSAYQIFCTEQEPYGWANDKAHIIAVGIYLAGATKRLTLAEVLQLIDTGNTFFTIGPSSKKRAEVETVWCKRCGRRIIRSNADAVKDNNLDYLDRCIYR